VVVPVIAIIIVITATKALPLFKAIQAKIDRLNLVLRESLTGVRVVRAFNRIEHERARFDGANRDLTEVSIKVNKIMALMMPLMMLIMNITTVGIIWFGARRIDLGEMQVKGKDELVHTFRPLKPKLLPGSLRGLESQGLSSPLVGREGEINLLSQKLEALQSGRGALIMVVGEAGLGKSRLISELRRQYSSNGKPELEWLEGQSISYRQSSGFYLWRQVIRQAVQALETDSPGEVRTKIMEHCTCSSLPGGDIPFIEALLAVESEKTLAEIRGYEGEVLVHRIT
jgi:hypothetical protein